MAIVNLSDLVSAVIHDDNFEQDMFTHDVEHVIGIAMKKIGLAAMTAPLRIDLGNGYLLSVKVQFIKSKLID